MTQKTPRLLVGAQKTPRLLIGAQKTPRLLIGAHMSISGGVDQAPVRGKEAGCVCVQIFTKSNMQWAARPLQEQEIAAFRRNCAELGIGPVMAHNSYLINLCAPDTALADKSLDAMALELGRCDQLGLPAIIMHPGSPIGSGEATGIRCLIAALNALMEKTADSAVKVLLETTAGQGSNLGWRFEQLAHMIDGVQQKARIGVCLDTCHVFAAGYDIRTKAGYQQVMAEFDRVIGLNRLLAFHLNDSKGELGARLDRHEHIGLGKLGPEPFRLLLRDERFAEVPKFLETPKGMKGKQDWDVVNLAVLRELAGE